VKIRAIFIRHGESTGNAGLPCNDLSQIELTKKGREQAEELAYSWTLIPSLIVTSPYLRARETAQPSIAKFSSVPVEVWPIHEFSYLEPTRWNGTSRTERLPYIDAYWKTSDPEYRDGPGAESFGDLLRRAEKALEHLRNGSHQADDVLLFSHGQFMQAIRMIVLYPQANDQEKMRLFWRHDGEPSIRNAEQIHVGLGPQGWAIVDSKA
jgi:2,3-bisphosphoglycerate-dependent phosphoglycerate mutase